MTRTLASILLVVAASFPLASAHGTAEAGELEVLVFSDEANDLQEHRGGWDVTQAFVGEAHDPNLGTGDAGDAVYWRVELYGEPGGASPLAAGEWRADLTFETPGGPVTRFIKTTDGQTFETDFDALITSTDEGVLHVERALVLRSGAKLAPGDALSDFRIVTSVNGEVRDVAPGGVPLAGPLVVPAGGDEASGDYGVTGPVRYASATIEKVDGQLALRVTSLLKKGSQHLYVELPPSLSSPDPLSVSVDPSGSAVFRLAGEIPEEGATFEATTDVGGRLPLAVREEAGFVRLFTAGEPSGEIASADGSSSDRAIPFPPALLLLAIAALALARRRA